MCGKIADCWATMEVCRWPGINHRPRAESVSNLPSRATRTAFGRASPGRSRPASRRSNVDLPAPEGPKITVHSEAKQDSTCRWKPPRRASRVNSSTTASARSPAQVNGREGNGAQSKQNDGCAVGRCVVEALNLVVEHDRERARGAGNVSTQHEHYAEFTYCMEKAEDRARYQRPASERNEKGQHESR